MISIAQECPTGEYIVPAGGSGCGTLTHPTNTPGITFAVGVDLTTNRVTYRKLSLTEAMFVGELVPNADYVPYIGWGMGGGTLTFNRTPTFFQEYYNETRVSFDLSAKTITLDVAGSLYGSTFSQTVPPDFEVTFSSVNGMICLGLFHIDDTEFDLTNTDFTNGIGICVQGGFPVAINNSVTLECGQYCKACHSVCAVCTGGTSNDCSSCNSGYFLQPSSTTCASTCPSNYYGNPTTKTCSACHSYCSTCSGTSNTQCSACKSGYYLQPSSSTTCLDTCPTPSYYADSSTNTCKSN